MGSIFRRSVILEASRGYEVSYKGLCAYIDKQNFAVSELSILGDIVNDLSIIRDLLGSSSHLHTQYRYLIQDNLDEALSSLVKRFEEVYKDCLISYFSQLYPEYKYYKGNSYISMTSSDVYPDFMFSSDPLSLDEMINEVNKFVVGDTLRRDGIQE